FSELCGRHSYLNSSHGHRNSSLASVRNHVEITFLHFWNGRAKFRELRFNVTGDRCCQFHLRAGGAAEPERPFAKLGNLATRNSEGKQRANEVATRVRFDDAGFSTQITRPAEGKGVSQSSTHATDQVVKTIDAMRGAVLKLARRTNQLQHVIKGNLIFGGHL